MIYTCTLIVAMPDMLRKKSVVKVAEYISGEVIHSIFFTYMSIYTHISLHFVVFHI